MGDPPRAATGIALGVVALGFTLWFFRDPRRAYPGEAEGGLLLAPADGKVVELVVEPGETTVLGLRKARKAETEHLVMTFETTGALRSQA